jgi:small subunit ribosomal protein S21
MRILVRDNNVEQALRFMKKKMQREGLFRELRMKEAFEKPSEKRVREHAEAIRRARKAERKKLQREGVLPMPKPKPRPERKSSPFPSTTGGAAAPATGTTGRY